MRVYEAFASALADHGVDTVFGLMGDANMRYLAEYRDHGGRFVAAVHEGGAVGMADAYARLTGRVGVASVTHGPALTNTLTFLVEAARSRTPLLVVTGETPLEPTHFQRIDIGDVAATAGAAHERVHRPTTVVRDLDRAMQRAVAERRPVVLDLPISMLRADAGERAVVRRPVPPPAARPDHHALDSALGLLASAERPIVLAGRGVVTSRARDELIALADRLAAPLATTVLAKDLFAGEPADLGILGSLAHGVAGSAIAESDCIVAFGASLNLFTADSGEIVKGKRIIQVDHDPAAFGSYTPVDEAVAGDARLVAAAMDAALAEAGIAGRGGWRDRIVAELAARASDDDFTDTSSADTVDVRAAMVRLDALLPAQRTVVSDIGRFVVGVWPHLHVSGPEHFTTMGAFGSIGLGLAGAVGAMIARPGQLGVVVIGDGGFMMHLSELTTAVREKLPLVVAVLDDGAYGAEHYKLARWGANADYSLTDWPDLVGLARAMGAEGVTVRKLSDLDVLADLVGDLDGPLLVDVRLDPNHNLVG